MCKNVRMPQIWQILMDYGIDFNGKSLLDLGAGYGDLCLLAYDSGAKSVTYIDNSSHNCSSMIDRIGDRKITVECADIEDYKWLTKWNPEWDYISCLSVIPYLTNHNEFLGTVSGTKSTFLLECQYAGDGPGFKYVTSDRQMAFWLSNYWDSIESIGRTLVKDRQKYRTIWVCKNE